MADWPIPVDVDDLTPEWLSAALGVPVVDAKVLDRSSGTTGRVRLALSYKEDAAGRPDSVFVKLPPFDERQRRFVDMAGLGTAEACFYREISASLPVRVPGVHVAEIDDAGRYVMVLEDLVGAGCRFPSLEQPDIADFTGRLVDELALLHAAFWEDPRLDAELAWVGQGGRLAFGGGGPFIRRALDRFADEMPSAFRRLGELYVTQTPAIAELWDVGPRTLAHGDAHCRNLFVDGGRPGFLDWAMLMHRSGMWDVAYVLCNGLAPEIRRAHEAEWIRRYLSGLAARGVQLDESTAWEQYRLFAVYAWVSATSTAGVGDRWQTAEYGHQGMTAATTAIDDLDSIGLLESLLAG